MAKGVGDGGVTGVCNWAIGFRVVCEDRGDLDASGVVERSRPGSCRSGLGCVGERDEEIDRALSGRESEVGEESNTGLPASGEASILSFLFAGEELGNLDEEEAVLRACNA